MNSWVPTEVLTGTLGEAVVCELAYAGDGRTLVVKGDLMGFDDIGVVLFVEDVKHKGPIWSLIPWHRVQTIQLDREIK